MGSIANKRGSVRQAPPEVYIGFGDHGDGDDDECWHEILHIGKRILILAALWVVLWGLAVVAWAIGWLPDSLLDYA